MNHLYIRPAFEKELKTESSRVKGLNPKIPIIDGEYVLGVRASEESARELVESNSGFLLIKNNLIVETLSETDDLQYWYEAGKRSGNGIAEPVSIARLTDISDPRTSRDSVALELSETLRSVFRYGEFGLLIDFVNSDSYVINPDLLAA